MIDPDYSVFRLEPEHTESLQKLFEQCADFAQLVEGESVIPEAAMDIFHSAPAGKSLADKFLYGLLNRQGTLVGVLEGMRHYPDDATWWIGLLLLAPETRRHGLGRKVIDAFAEYMRLEKGRAVMLGVVEENEAAFRFWQQMGFEFVRQTGPRPFGRKTQKVNVMRREIPVGDN